MKKILFLYLGVLVVGCQSNVKQAPGPSPIGRWRSEATALKTSVGNMSVVFLFDITSTTIKMTSQCRTEDLSLDVDAVVPITISTGKIQIAKTVDKSEKMGGQRSLKCGAGFEAGAMHYSLKGDILTLGYSSDAMRLTRVK